jgi:hypothetical protein
MVMFSIVTPLWRMTLTFPKCGLESPPRLSKTQNSIAGVKTPRLEVFFIPFRPHMSHLDICSTSYGRKKGRESNWQFDSWPLKVGNRPNPGVCRWSATHCWKALEESYKFSLDLIPIRGLRWELWAPKVLGIQTRTVSGLLLGSPGTKSHSNVGVVGKHREYYMGEGGGFLRIRAVMS